MAKNKKMGFEEWIDEVDELIGDRLDSSLRDLEGDIDADLLKECYDEGMSPSSFVKREVEPLFDMDDDED